MSELAPNPLQKANAMAEQHRLAQEEGAINDFVDVADQQSMDDFNAYMKSRPYQTKGGQVKGANGKFTDPNRDYAAPAPDFMQLDPNDGQVFNERIERETLADTDRNYENMSPTQLVKELAEAEVAGDKTKFMDLDELLSNKVKEIASREDSDEAREKAEEEIHKSYAKFREKIKTRMSEDAGVNDGPNVGDEESDGKKSENENLKAEDYGTRVEEMLSGADALATDEAAEAARVQFLRLSEEAEKAARKGNESDAIALSAEMAKIIDQLGLSEEQQNQLSIDAQKRIEAARQEAGGNTGTSGEKDTKNEYMRSSVEAAELARQKLEETKESTAYAKDLLDIRAKRSNIVGKGYQEQKREFLKELQRPIDETDDPRPPRRTKELSDSLKPEKIQSYMDGDFENLDETFLDEMLRARYAKRDLVQAEQDALANYWRFMKADGKDIHNEEDLKEINHGLAEIVDGIYPGGVNRVPQTPEQQTSSRWTAIKGAGKALREKRFADAWSGIKDASRFEQSNDDGRNRVPFVGAAVLAGAGVVTGAAAWEAIDEDEKHGEVSAFIEENIDLDQQMKEDGVEVDDRKSILNNQDRFARMINWRETEIERRVNSASLEAVEALEAEGAEDVTLTAEQLAQMRKDAANEVDEQLEDYFQKLDNAKEEQEQLMEWRDQEIERRFDERVLQDDENRNTATTIDPKNWDIIRAQVEAEVDKDLENLFKNAEDKNS